MIVKTLKNRDLYLNRLIAFRDIEPVKVVTGIRRCGKSSLLNLMVNHLISEGILNEQIIKMNFESYEFRNMTSDDLYAYVKSRVIPGNRVYLFFDEIQRINKWEEAVNAFRVDFDCDIYITGSNAYLLSSEYSTYLSGRCVEIKLLPLSFKEFLYFHNYTINSSSALQNEECSIFNNTTKETCSLRSVFDLYLRYGGMPGIVDVGFDQDKILTLLDGIYSTVVMRDILEREKRRDQRQITDPILLRKIILFLSDNIGNSVSLNSIGNTLIAEGLLQGRRRGNSLSAHTVQSYVSALTESYIFYEAKRFDVKGKDYLRTLGKYYISDIGLRNYLLGFRNRDIGHILENIVYFELLSRGYDIAIGKLDAHEIDFIATNADEKLYIQVTETMSSDNIRARELAPLNKIRDHYKKLVLTLEPSLETDYDGIQVVSLINWLIGLSR